MLLILGPRCFCVLGGSIALTALEKNAIWLPRYIYHFEYHAMTMTELHEEFEGSGGDQVE